MARECRGPTPAASYRLDASVDLDKSTVTVTERVTFRNVVGAPLDTLVFHVIANSLRAFSLTSVAVDGQPGEPAKDIVTAVAAREASRATDRQDDLPTCLVQILGKLDARLPGPDHQHRSGRKRRLAAICR